MKRERIDREDEEERASSRGPYRRHKRDLSARRFRSALTNGSDLFLADIDLRAGNARRFRDLLAMHENDLGGADMLSSAQAAIVRRMTMAQVLCELYEATFVQRLDDPTREGEEKLYGQTRLAQYVTFSNLQVRLAALLGLHVGRTPRNVTPAPDKSNGEDARTENTRAILRYLDGELA